MFVAEEQQRQLNTAVGFHARLTSSSIPKYPTPIKYDYVLVNKGGRYSSSTGTFIADRAGLYYFEQYWLQNPNYRQSLIIRKNQDEVCRSYGDSAASGNYNAPSCSGVVELHSGDQVYVSSDDGDDIGCDGCTGFTGFLIKSY